MIRSLAILAVLLSTAAGADGTTCMQAAPVVAPRARQVVVNCPGDGGTTGCTMYAVSTTGAASPGLYPIGNGKCATACSMGDQAVANDNGWSDGGAP